MKVSEAYRQLNRQMHEDKPHYGSASYLSEPVKQLMAAERSRDILDYGCGKRGLEKDLGFPIQNYDPAIPGCDNEPSPADIVCCGDVLEHIEPECLDEVLAHLKTLTKRVLVATVHIGPANKHLPDGRNAHLIQQSREWWLGKLLQHFTLLQYVRGDKHAVFILGNGDLYRAD